MHRLLMVLMLACVALVQSAAPAHAQKTDLDISNTSLTFPVPSGDDFNSGYLIGGSTTFTVGTSAGPNGQRTTTVSIRCTLPCPSTGAQPLSSIKWKRSDQGTWNTLTTSYATVETRVLVHRGTNDPWSNSIDWRVDLGWLTDPPAAVSRFNIQFQLTVTTP